MLDEADEHCRSGEHLLALAADDDRVAYRRWHLDQVATELAGEPPVPWSGPP